MKENLFQLNLMLYSAQNTRSLYPGIAIIGRSSSYGDIVVHYTTSRLISRMGMPTMPVVQLVDTDFKIRAS